MIWLLRWLIRLYPGWWRREYGAEFTDMVVTLVEKRRRDALSLAADIVLGALDAHVGGGRARPARVGDPALRRGLYDGLCVAAAIAVVRFLNGAVFPMGPNQTDDDAPYRQEIVAAYLAILVVLVVTGMRARRRSDSRYAGAKAGAMAGLVISVLFIATFLAVDNLFFATVSQQHEQLSSFRASHWISQRAFINVNLLRGTEFFVPTVTMTGALLGQLGGRLARSRRAPA